MKELLGIIVLSMPILAVLCIGGLAGYAGWAAARHVNDTKRKWAAWLAAALTVVLVFLGDEIAGRIYFSYLCATHTGVKLSKRAELQAQYWDANEVPRSRIVKEESRFLIRVGDRFEIDNHQEKDYTRIFRIDRDRLSIRDLVSGEVLSEMYVFRYWGGWLARNFSLDVSAIGCPDEVAFKEFYRSTFVKKPGG